VVCLPLPHGYRRYDDAVEQTVVNIGLALAGKEIEPEDSEEGG
jgi:hypothetical protein